MTALLVDVLIYGVPAAIGIGALTMMGRYYGRNKPPKPDENKPQPKDE